MDKQNCFYNLSYDELSLPSGFPQFAMNSVLIFQYRCYCRLGLEHIYHLTRSGSHILRVTLEDWEGTTRYAEYSDFHLEDEQDKYRLRYARFLGGSAGDALGGYGHKNQPFSTPDNDNDRSSRNCAASYQSGWWFKACFRANLNGPYQTSSNDGSFDGIQWSTWKYHYSFKSASMMIRRSDL